MENLPLDLNKKESWISHEKTAQQIAIQLGYLFNVGFINALIKFKPIATHATVTDYLGIIGEKHLRDYSPPLERVKEPQPLATHH